MSEKFAELRELAAEVWTPPFVGADEIVASVNPKLVSYVMAACNSIPELLAERDALREALEWYAGADNYKFRRKNDVRGLYQSEVMHDRGDRAREALAKVPR